MKKRISAKGILEIVKQSFKGFSQDKLTKLSGSLAYCTVFSFGPLLIVIIFLSSIFFGQQAVEGQIYRQLDDFLGPDNAAQLQEIIKKATVSGKGTIAAIIGFVTLLFAATTVFAEIQDSINSIWGLKPKPKKGWLKMLKNRVLSFSVIASLGFLLVVSLGITAVIDALSRRLEARFPDITVVVFYIINQLVTLLVVWMIFAVVFKILPDAKIRWRDVFAGSLVTAILFMLGKFAISFYISKASIGSTYGAAGSLVVLLVWTYYSSLILYIGAEFTKAYAIKYGLPIYPNDYAVTIKQVEVEEGKKSVKQVEDEKK
ncbi:MAG TPA: YihY/virulence factor BrkB family protein [Chitinophagaceae bacterium]|nr:YihY/virulence factor BrkB family protein [Chitinophagaceae bacterium]